MLKYAELAKLGKTGWKQYLFSILLILFFHLVLGGILYFATVVNTGNTNPFVVYISLNLTIILMLIGLFLSIKFIHKRKFRTLITPYEKINWSKICIGFCTFFILLAMSSIIEYFVHPSDFKLTVDIDTFFATLPIIIIVTILQTTTEELFFRGYIVQLFGLFLKNKMLLAFISGFIFLLPHLLNPELQNGVYTMIFYYFTFGLLLAVVTLRSNTLEIAIGAHAVNNLFCLILLNYENTVSPSNSIFTLTDVYPLFSLIQLIIQALIFYYIVVKYIGKSVDRTEKSPTILG
jgi:membrane protease YdiL (CAAX protease family)